MTTTGEISLHDIVRVHYDIKASSVAGIGKGYLVMQLFDKDGKVFEVTAWPPKG